MLGLGCLKFVPESSLLRPPGGQDEDRLLSACIRCEKCYTICPNDVIRPAHVEDGLIGMREQEGERMCEDILEKIGNIERLRDGIAERAPLVVCEYRDKLQQRIAALTEGEIDEARLMTEVAIFAYRAAIDEELVRLKSHAAAIRETAALAEPVGRKLDFLVQELNREVNTIGSKASDTAIAQAVVSAKGEIEKLREQVQNVE